MGAPGSNPVPMGAIPRMLRLPRALPRPGRITLGPELKRRVLIALAVVLALAAGYVVWFRNSSFVKVEEVTITGLEQREDLQAPLRAAALDQTTLNVSAGELEAAIASDPAVRAVTYTADFPHALAVDVELRPQVGYVKGVGVVADDGILLEGAAKRPDGVAVIQTAEAPAAVPPGKPLKDDALVLARILGAAPAPLVPEIARIRPDETFGIVAELRSGIELRFGNRSDAALKWQAAAIVLADPKLESLTYIDLSVPNRPVAGGVEGGGSDVVPEVVVPAPAPAPETVDPAVAAPAAPAPETPAPAAPADPAAAPAQPAPPPATDPAAAGGGGLG